MQSSFIRPTSSLAVASAIITTAFLALTVPCRTEEPHAVAAPTTAAASASSLPDDPSVFLTSSNNASSSSIETDEDAGLDLTPQQQQARSRVRSILRPRVKLVQVGMVAPPQKARDKLVLSLRESITPFAMLGWSFSAGWSHLIDSSPNYGTNSKAFAQRLGAAAALNSSKEIFSDGVLAIAFHQDPRYYQLGKSHTITQRGVYAASRAIIGRTDSGRTIPNYAFILGTGGAAALTHTYYPERNVTPGQVMQTWATSLGGTAVGYIVSEFGGELIGLLRIKKLE